MEYRGNIFPTNILYIILDMPATVVQVVSLNP